MALNKRSQLWTSFVWTCFASTCQFWRKNVKKLRSYWRSKTTQICSMLFPINVAVFIKLVNPNCDHLQIVVVRSRWKKRSKNQSWSPRLQDTRVSIIFIYWHGGVMIFSQKLQKKIATPGPPIELGKIHDPIPYRIWQEKNRDPYFRIRPNKLILCFL